MLGSEKEFAVTKARTHGPGRSVPMYKSWVWRPLGYPGAPKGSKHIKKKEAVNGPMILTKYCLNKCTCKFRIIIYWTRPRTQRNANFDFKRRVYLSIYWVCEVKQVANDDRTSFSQRQTDFFFQDIFKGSIVRSRRSLFSFLTHKKMCLIKELLQLLLLPTVTCDFCLWSSKVILKWKISNALKCGHDIKLPSVNEEDQL